MELDAATRLRRGRSTWSLLGLTALVTALPVLSATRSVLTALGVLEVDAPSLRGGLVGFGLVNDDRSARVAEGFAALVSVPVALTCLIVLGGLLTWLAAGPGGGRPGDVARRAGRLRAPAPAEGPARA